MSLAEAYPLQWPATWKRTRSRERPRFKDRTFAQACSFVYDELRRHGVGDWNVVISSNLPLRRDGLPYSGQRQPDDPGIAVYFRIDGKPHVLACDRWLKVEQNLYAVGLHIEALRGMERWGVGTANQAFAGYKALPETASEVTAPWREVLGAPPHGADADWVRGRFRELVKDLHPDAGGDGASFRRLVIARDEALKALGGVAVTS